MQRLIHQLHSNGVLPYEMSIKLIQQYYNEKHRIRNSTKQDSENVLRQAFARVLEGYATKQNLALCEKVTYRTAQKNLIRFDGVLKNEMGLDFGYWEAKANVNLEDEICKKFNKGYPKSNILFEDGVSVVLYQEGERILSSEMANSDALHEILQQFFAYETRELRDFRQAVADFIYVYLIYGGVN